MGRYRTLREMTQEVAKVICLFETPFANFDDIGQISPNIAQELAPNLALTAEEASQRIVINGRL